MEPSRGGTRSGQVDFTRESRELFISATEANKRLRELYNQGVQERQERQVTDAETVETTADSGNTSESSNSRNMTNFDDQDATDQAGAADKAQTIRVDFDRADVKYWVRTFEVRLEYVGVKSQWLKRICL